MSPPTKSDLPPTSGPDNLDPRPHVAALLELAALGWYVTAIRPDRTAPALWRVSIERFDGYVSISVTEADPDDALDELIRYAAVDRDPDPDVAHGAADVVSSTDRTNTAAADPDAARAEGGNAAAEGRSVQANGGE